MSDEIDTAAASGLTEARVNEIINSAIASRFKRAGDQIVDQVRELMDERMADLPASKDADKKPDADTGGDKRLAAVEKELAESKQEALTAKKRESLRAALKDQRIDGLSDFTINGMLDGIEESGGEFFVGDKPVAAWAKDYARTDEGKRYIPAKTGTGTGARPGISYEPKLSPGSAAEWDAKTNRDLFSALTATE